LNNGYSLAAILGFFGMAVLGVLLIGLFSSNSPFSRGEVNLASSGFWSIVAALGILATGVIAVIQLWRFRRARRDETTINEIHNLQTEKWANKERQVYKVYMDNHDSSRDWSKYFESLDCEELNVIRDVARQYERIGLLAHEGLLNEKILMKAIHVPIYRLWIALKPWMEYEKREKKAGITYFFSMFCELAKRSFDFHEKNYLGEEAILYHPDDHTINKQIYPPDMPQEEKDRLWKFCSHSGK